MVTIPVTDVDQALAFYRDRVGFPVDVDYAPTADFRVVQLTPPGSAASIQFGTGLTAAAPGSAQMNYLVVGDVLATRDELLERGVSVDPVVHKVPLDMWVGGTAPGVEESRADYASFADFSDPDGNTWRLQEIGHAAITSGSGRGGTPA